MTSLADELQAKKQNLKQVSTVITNVDGKKFLKENLTQCDEELVSIGQTHGFCVDTNLDDKIHHIVDNLYISSQDGAHNFQELIDHKITHILNVATGVVNAFPEASASELSCYPNRKCCIIIQHNLGKQFLYFSILIIKMWKYWIYLKKT